MIDLYFAPTANGRRALLALEECELPYQLHRVELGKPKPDALLEVNPLGAIPAESRGPTCSRRSSRSTSSPAPSAVAG
jgi:hypothetical protein